MGLRITTWSHAYIQTYTINLMMLIVLNYQKVNSVTVHNFLPVFFFRSWMLLLHLKFLLDLTFPCSSVNWLGATKYRTAARHLPSLLQRPRAWLQFQSRPFFRCTWRRRALQRCITFSRRICSQHQLNSAECQKYWCNNDYDRVSIFIILHSHITFCKFPSVQNCTPFCKKPLHNFHCVTELLLSRCLVIVCCLSVRQNQWFPSYFIENCLQTKTVCPSIKRSISL